MFSVGKLKPLLRARQKRFLYFGIGNHASEFDAFCGCLPA